MKRNQTTRPTRDQRLKLIATNLFRSDLTGIYYSIFKRKGHQVKRSLRTTDPQLARRRLGNSIHKYAEPQNVEKNIFFAQVDASGRLTGGLAKRWLDNAGVAIEPSTRDRYLDSIRQLNRFFRGMSARKIDSDAVEKWAETRAPQCSARTFNKERTLLLRVFEYGIEHGILPGNPAARIKSRKPHKKVPAIPSHEEFRQLLAVMRANGGHKSADLMELLSLSGCRVSEIVGNKKYNKEPMRWRDIDFTRRTFTVRRSKNHRDRVVRLFHAMEVLLRRLRDELPAPPKPNDRIIPICCAKKSIESACRKLGLPKYGHHTARHIFCSNALERGVTPKAIARWVGHQDGGTLVIETYGHLRDEHDDLMAQRMDEGAAEFEQPTNIVPIGAGLRRTHNG